MPSAANVKIDKQISSENALPDSATNSLTPVRQCITIIEHKIRNLEKRKAKLESYRELQNSGKDLNQDQKVAVAKYDEVVQTLEFARDLYKQFLSVASVTEKEAKKQARKDAAARSQTELAKVREVLLVQDALNQMGQDNIREDFLLGRNGAASLTSADLKLLDDLYPVVSPKHEAGDPMAFTNQVQAAAEHLLSVVDGKPKEAFGGTYSQIKEVIGKIHESGYLDQAVDGQVCYEEAVVLAADVESEHVNHEPVAPVLEAPVPLRQQEPLLPIASMTIEASRPPAAQAEPAIEQLPPEQVYYQQPPRPISEVIGTGSFYFLQDSELDTPPEQLPSQTFTNTSFMTAPPPPIPMPPHFQTFPGNPPPPGNGIEEPQEQPDESQRQRGGGRPRPPNQPFYQNNNGYSRQRQNRNGPRSGSRHNQ